jgi:hypothetical protein
VARPEITGRGSKRYQPRRETALRYGVVTRTIERWEADRARTGFPPSIIRNGRRYDDIAALDEWDAACAAAQRASKMPSAKSADTDTHPTP